MFQTDPEVISEEDFDRVRDFADKLEELACETKIPRGLVVAAMGVSIGEQFKEAHEVGLACISFQTWATTTFEHAEPVTENDRD
jgi:acetyl-CoA carboxylase carboxyltransferase component